VPRKTTRTRRTVNPKVAFGVVLRRLREQRGDSQEAFAHRTGYHRNYIGQLERGEKSPSLNALFNLSEAFDKRPSEVLRLVEKHISRGSWGIHLGVQTLGFRFPDSSRQTCLCTAVDDLGVIISWIGKSFLNSASVSGLPKLMAALRRRAVNCSNWNSLCHNESPFTAWSTVKKALPWSAARDRPSLHLLGVVTSFVRQRASSAWRTLSPTAPRNAR